MNLDDILNSHRTRRPVVMGILNVTPDSFSDGGRFLDPSAAIEQARQLVAQGADILDIGAESTRPGSRRVSAQEQIARLGPVLPALADMGIAISVDTTRSQVAQFALDAGTAIINDISAGQDDQRMLPLVASRGAAIILMHMLGQPATMQAAPHYADVTAEVKLFLAGRMSAARDAGVAQERIILDPGIGFGKTTQHNLQLLAQIDQLCQMGQPVLVGTSRKRFIGELTGEANPADRVHATVATCLESYFRGATIFRVHDVAPLKAALAVADAIRAAARN